MSADTSENADLTDVAPRARDSRAILFGAGLIALTLLFYGGLYGLWLAGHRDAYMALTRFWGIDTWDRPFLDLAGVFSWSECHRHGMDVLRNNPCDPLGRPLNYGPPILALPFGGRDTAAAALAMSVAFLAALPFVLRPRTWGGFAIAAAAALSTATLFALERGNLDLFEFLLVALAGFLASKGRAGRIVSLALYYLGGALKFYPFALLVLVLRERPRTAALFGAISAAAIGAYAWFYWPELVAIRALLPDFYYNSDTFGASLLPFGLAEELELPLSFAIISAVVLYAGFGALALHLAVRWMRSGPLPDWNAAAQHFLLAGAVVMTSCFVLEMNLDYRAIFLLFMFAGLLELRAAARTRFFRRVFSFAVGGALFCMWGEFFRRALDKVLDAISPGHPDAMPWKIATNAFFVGRELVWWGVMTVAAAAFIVFVFTSPTARAFRADERGPA